LERSIQPENHGTYALILCSVAYNFLLPEQRFVYLVDSGGCCAKEVCSGAEDEMGTGEGSRKGPQLVSEQELGTVISPARPSGCLLGIPLREIVTQVFAGDSRPRR
jgi:hypothetical protein